MSARMICGSPGVADRNAPLRGRANGVREQGDDPVSRRLPSPGSSTWALFRSRERGTLPSPSPAGKILLPVLIYKRRVPPAGGVPGNPRKAVSGLSRRRSRVRVPSLPLKYLQSGKFCCRLGRNRPPASLIAHPRQERTGQRVRSPQRLEASAGEVRGAQGAGAQQRTDRGEVERLRGGSPARARQGLSRAPRGLRNEPGSLRSILLLDLGGRTGERARCSMGNAKSPVGTQQPEDHSRLDPKVDAAQGLDVAEALSQVVSLDYSLDAAMSPSYLRFSVAPGRITPIS
jgi:hypothetical protein